MKYVTKGGGLPNGKRRVYFTCHPGDFERSFEKIRDDIFKTHDVAIYYADPSDAGDEPASDSDLEQMNLLVIPVSLKLLSEPNQAVDNDLKYALASHIPVLPIMLERELQTLYKKHFGSMEYLSVYGTDATAISYEDKLKKYLESVLVGDELATRIREAFDAYIFLSYRKKDRQYANELMRLIHKNPVCRDIAIWYDEFLVPGEAFDQAIVDAMNKSNLFALVVTPHLIEKDEKNENIRNYVETTEYPQACEAKKKIVPVEMVETDREELESRYSNIPECVIPGEDDEFYDQFIQAVKREAKTGKDNDPVHTFLIGLAYLEGIDVEVDRDRGVDLVRSAAEAGLPEAMEKLAYMYRDGYGVEMYRPAFLSWYEKFVDAYEKQPDADGFNLLSYRSRLADLYSEFGEHKKAIELQESVYETSRSICGENHPNTLGSMNNLAMEYHLAGNHKKSLELIEQVYEVNKQVLGEDHPDTITCLNNLAMGYASIGNHKKALELQERAYEISRRVLGENHPDTLRNLNNLAGEYSSVGDHNRALESKKQVYETSRNVLGEDHPDTLKSLSILAFEYGKIGDHQKALELFECVYEAEKRIFGEDHPDTLKNLNNLATEYYHIGEYEKALELNVRVYETCKFILGEGHPDTLFSLSNLAGVYYTTRNYEKALELFGRAYETSKHVLGEDHPNTLKVLGNLAGTYSMIGNHGKALELYEHAYETGKRILGEDHPDTLSMLNGLADEYREIAQLYSQAGEHKKALELYKHACKTSIQLWGEDHLNTISCLFDLAFEYGETGDHKTALELNERIYDVRKRTLGESHPDTLVSIFALAYESGKIGDREKAIEYLELGYRIAKTAFGEDNSFTQKFKQSLADM